MNVPGASAAKHLVIQLVGWVMLLVGMAALFLPGPGLLLMFGGLAILARYNAWAERWLDPVRLRALRGAADGVETWPRILMSSVFAVGLAVVGVVWIIRPDSPAWWPISDFWWLPGGLGTGLTLIVSSILAVALIVYSYRRFHGKPEAVAALEGEIEEADEEIGWEHEHHHDR